jgi:hypothetical protein
MNTNIDSFTVTVPLTLSAHAQAKQFRYHQSDPDKAKRVYLNALAVYAVNYYLQCLGFETDWGGSASCNLVQQTLMDVADLNVKDCGKLECRNVMAGSEFVFVPEEVLTDRVGYVAVQFDETLRHAVLLGFAETVSECQLALNRMRSLDKLPRYLNQLKSAKTVQKPVNLSQWLENIFDTGWQVVENLFAQPQPAFNFRGSDCLSAQPLENPSLAVSQSKLLSLEPTGEQIVLAIGLQPTIKPEMEIWVKVCPSGTQTHLPPDLQLMVVDETGEIVMQAQARSTESILLKFSGTVGERFSLKIVLDEIGVSETFVI